MHPQTHTPIDCKNSGATARLLPDIPAAADVPPCKAKCFQSIVIIFLKLASVNSFLSVSVFSENFQYSVFDIIIVSNFNKIENMEWRFFVC